MAFGKKRVTPQVPARPNSRTIPQLDPGFFTDIHNRLIRNGGTDSEQEIAAGVANAIFNVGSRTLTELNDRRAVRDFNALFEDRSADSPGAADDMIDWLIVNDQHFNEL